MLKEGSIEKFNIRLGKEYAEHVPQLLTALKSIPDIEASQQGEEMVELTYKDANKGVAVAEMANRLGIDCSEVMAIGDNDNDISMLTFAGVGVAMGQAEESVKEHADYVTSSNDELGVAKAIQKFIIDSNEEAIDFPSDLIERIKRANSEPVVYCRKGCSTCKKALDWLREHHVSFTEREITEERPSADSFIKYLNEPGYTKKRFFNTSGRLYREMGLKDKLDEMSVEERAKLLSENGMLIKRPLLVYDGVAIPGFNARKWSEILNIDEKG